MSKESIIRKIRHIGLRASQSGSQQVRKAVDHLIPRRRRQDALQEHYLIKKTDFEIRLANLNRRLDTVEMLVTRMYSQRGYKTERTAESKPADFHLNRVTLEACRQNETVGTITVALDGPAGLNAEDLYREEIRPYRDSGGRLCEFTRLALDVDKCGKDALGSLFHLAVIFAYNIHGATDLFIEVNPRHATFYRRKLGFKIVGKEKICRRVDAPAVLLHQKLSYISEQIIRFGGLKLKQNKSFYSYFMPPWEEREMATQIRTMLTRTDPDRLDSAAINSSAA